MLVIIKKYLVLNILFWLNRMLCLGDVRQLRQLALKCIEVAELTLTEDESK